MSKLSDLIFDNKFYIIGAILILLLATVAYFTLNKVRRITSIKDLPKNYMNMKLVGIVTHIGDGDGFNFFHTPRFRSSVYKANQETLPIRLAAIDAPEVRNFNKQAQPMALESKYFLKKLILNKKVTIEILGIDAYSRVLAEVMIGKKNVGVESLKAGMSCVYTGKNAVYGKNEKKYRRTEEIAIAKKVGIWSLKNYESPMDYKKRVK